MRTVLVSVGSAGCVVCCFFAPDDDGRGCDFCFSLSVGVFFFVALHAGAMLLLMGVQFYSSLSSTICHRVLPVPALDTSLQDPFPRHLDLTAPNPDPHGHMLN